MSIAWMLRRLGAEQADAQTGLIGLNALTLHLVGDGEHVRRRAADDGWLEILDELYLLLGLAAGHRNDGAAERLSAVVRAEAAGEQAVAIGVEDDVVGAGAGGAHRTRHQPRPGVDILLRIADDGRLARRAG